MIKIAQLSILFYFHGENTYLSFMVSYSARKLGGVGHFKFFCHLCSAMQ